MELRKQLVVLGLIATAAASQAQTWDLTSDYSGTTNPNGVWSYGQNLNGSFSAFNQSLNSNVWTANGNTSGAFIYQNLSGSSAYGIDAGQISLEADLGTPEVQFTAPKAGLYSIQVALGGTTQWENNAVYGSGVGNYDAANGSLLIGGVTQSYNSFQNNVMSFDVLTHLNAGETVDALVRQQYIGGNTEAKFSVAAVPEPKEIAVLGLGLLGMVFRRRRVK